jgi:SAM-dependent methyltransferase
MAGLVEWARRLETAGVFGGPEEENRQLAWYAAHRKRIYRNVGIRNYERALEIGCGTGGLTEELEGRVREYAVGIDVRPEALAYADKNRDGKYVVADALALPFAEGSFGVIAFAFTVMWLADPLAVFGEARRVLRNSGLLLVFAEPDYFSLVDEPPKASSKGEVIAALKVLGADPEAGTEIEKYAEGAGFRNINAGSLDSAWTDNRLADEEDIEMDGLRRLISVYASKEKIEEIAAARRRAISEGSRRYVLPISYLTATR